METTRADAEQILTRFNRLIREVQEGRLKRNTFTPWEVELILDMETCDLTGFRTKEVLKRYQKAVNRQLERTPSMPMKLSDYLATRHRQKKAKVIVRERPRQPEMRNPQTIM